MIPVTPAETDEPRRDEPDWALCDDEPDTTWMGEDIDPNTDEHGRVMRPGSAPFYGGLA